MNTARRPHTFFEQEYPNQLEMVRTSTPSVEVPPLPAGYLLRQLGSREDAAYDELFHLAFADRGRFSEIVARTLPGGFFVVEHFPSHQLVSSCVALRGSSSPRHPDAGQLGWLVTDPAHCRKGLGTIVSTAVTNRFLQEGYTRPFLGTEDQRLAAIAIYLKLGWRPYIYARDLEERWQRIYTQLGRPYEPTDQQQIPYIFRI